MAVLVARHGERLDYVDPAGFFASGHGQSRPWDPPLTDAGRAQGALLGRRVQAELAERGLPPVTKVYASPFIRTVQTADAACEVLGVETIRVENGLVEALCKEWFRSWALPGADGQWDGPAHLAGTDVPAAELHGKVHAGPAGWLLTSDELHERVSKRVCRKYTPHTAVVDSGISFAAPEEWAAVEARCGGTVRRVAAGHAEETSLFVTHGGPTGTIYSHLSQQGEPPKWSGYTALFAYHPRHGEPGAWPCFITACNKHIDTAAAE
eukprot:TRINITY_DN30077_c0_g1_i1.p2 TRINITY_DN30077_c0_g1~~TRINITY_DN30077_c0_g1_i1.p2  ORF type:complete len:266 (+),score=76.78 TRINITY_DN30077_c0_g1_i1:76-873(+)